MMKRIIVSLLGLLIFAVVMAPGSDAFELNGFGDVSFSKCTNGPTTPSVCDESRNGNFAFGTLDFYLAQSQNDIDILVELVVEEGAVLDLERLTIGYTFSDALRLRAGRFHTPLGFWNTSFHHGVQLQPTINRPEFLNFEDDGGILPVHTVGVYLSGRMKSDVLATEYGIMAGNGPKMTSEDGQTNLIDPNNVADNSMGKAIAFSVAVSPQAISGLKLGVSGYRTRLISDGSVDLDLNGDGDNTDAAEVGTGTIDVDQTILNGSLMYNIGDLDLMGEYYSIKDEDNIGTAGSNTSSAYYGLISYTVAYKWVPYLLYENMSVKEADPYFIALGSSDVKKTIGGLRYNITYRSSVKAEYRDVSWGADDWKEYGLQWALAF